MKKEKISAIKYLNSIAKSRGGKLLSKNYINNNTKLKFECEEGHIWEVIPHSIKSGTWCPQCALQNRRKALVKENIKDMQRLAAKYKGQCISKEYINAITKLEWKCKAGHRWWAIPDSVKRGHWCGTCAGVKLGTIEEMQKLAKEKKGLCLSKKYAGSHGKLKWKCKNSHTWKASPTSIKNGVWCSICSQGLSERKCRKYFEKIFMKKFSKSRPNWLINSIGKRMELDGYCNGLKLAFEYQGVQHYEESYWNNTQQLIKRKKDDKLKKILCRKHGISLIQVPYKIFSEKMDSKKIELWIKKECIKQRIKIPKMKSKINPQLWDISPPEMIKEIQEIAKREKGKLLSPKYLGAKVPLKWQCQKEHRWFASPTNIKSGQWCPKCASITARTPRKWSIEKMKKIAKKEGGKCLSKVYINTETKLKWQCCHGHTWEAKPMDIITGRWCPRCAGNQKGTIEEMKKIAKSRGGMCLSKKYFGSFIKLKFKCKKGHTWEAQPSNIKFGQWCPHCAGIAKLSIQEMRQLASKKGGKCLSQKYINARTKLKWICKKGHTWWTIPEIIKRGGWCPRCAGKKKNVSKCVDKIEKKIRERVKVR